MNIETIKTDQINLWSPQKRGILKTKLTGLYIQAFPGMPKDQINISVEDYFTCPGKNLVREVFLFKKETNKLVASAVFDRTTIDYHSETLKGIYSISRAVLPQNQGLGLGKVIAKKIFTDYEPDILFATCAQSASLYSWIRLSENGIIKGYNAYPRLEEKNGKQGLITFPLREMDFAVSAFRQAYNGIVASNPGSTDEPAANLTSQMVRKNIYTSLYNHDPWNNYEKKDVLVKKLGLTQKDGILVILIKSKYL